ncbi:MAG: phage tail tape measure protein [Pontixanthobacter sp.]
MATMLGSLMISLGLDSAKFKRGMSDAERQMVVSQKKFAKVGRNMANAGKTLSLGITAPFLAFSGLSFKAATDAEELQSAFDVTFAGMSDSMNRWAEETGDTMGRSTQAMQEAANKFGTLLTNVFPEKEAAAMSKELAALSVDLGSFFNMADDDALQKLRSGLAGESEPLKDFGILMNEATVKAKALELGLGGVSGKLTEQEKIQARYALILENTTDAQGDAVRTADSTANQMKRAEAAWQELTVTIGTKLLPVLTPVITKIAEALNWFAQLPGPVKSVTLVIGGLVAALGPVLYIAGNLTSAFGLLLPLLPTLGAGAATAGAGAATGAAGFAAFAAAALPVVAIGAAIAGAAALIYANWDKIGPVLGKIRDRFVEVLGPKMQALVDGAKAKFAELWEGPLGQGIRKVVKAIGEFQAAYLSVLGEGFTRVISAAISIVDGMVSQITNGIDLVVSILTGDWAGAWQAAKNLVSNVVDTILGVIESLWPGATESMKKMYQGIKLWLQDKLGAIFNWVGQKVEDVKGAFFDLYDAVVGHSYIPDMVDGIGEHMARLDTLMVDKAAKTTQKTGDAFRNMAGEVRGLLARLFPDAERLMNYKADLKKIADGQEAGQLDPALADRARRAARDEYLTDQYGKAKVKTIDMGQIENAGDDLKSVSKDMADDAEIQTVRVSKSFADMANDTMSAIENMANAIKGGGFFDILKSAIGLFTQIGSTGILGKGLASKLTGSSVPSYAMGTSYHHGGLALVGEQGPELVTMGRGASVLTNRETRAALGGSKGELVVRMQKDGNLEAHMAGIAGKVVVDASPELVNAAADAGVSKMAKINARRF